MVADSAGAMGSLFDGDFDCISCMVDLAGRFPGGSEQTLE
jgi:hypothetical protein